MNHPASPWHGSHVSCNDVIMNAMASQINNLTIVYSTQWRHNERYGVSNHQPHDCLLNRLSRPRSNKASKLNVTGLCVGNSPVTGEFPEQRASNAENVHMTSSCNGIHAIHVLLRGCMRIRKYTHVFWAWWFEVSHGMKLTVRVYLPTLHMLW